MIGYGAIAVGIVWMVLGAGVSYLPKDQRKPAWILWAIIGLLVAAYWNALGWAYDSWERPQYSHGYLVPLFTVFLVWIRREPLGPVSNQERWIGLGILALFLSARTISAHYEFQAPDMYTFVPAILGALLMCGGWSLLRWAGPPVLFLAFMFPLSYKMEQVILTPLQKVAMKGATYALQTTGIETYAIANQIKIRNLEGTEYLELTVAEACSGLRMLTIFIAMAVAITIVNPGALWEKIVIILSALPIALFVNVARIVVYGIIKLFSEYWATEFHDTYAAFFMMPLAMGMLYLEYIILQNLVIDEKAAAAPIPVFGGGMAPGARPTFTPRP
ncbi:MAG: exosortase/archaeosortase family protein [Planctomycetota bacterium]|nr:exosortase/archaeosortase family protein [Planctomycetota bacterium]